jgi:hypothetical protein
VKLAELKAPKKHSVKRKMKALHTISVKVDKNRISMSARKQMLSKKAGDEVVWNCTGGKMSITWPGSKGSPFNSSNFEGGAKTSIASGPIVGVVGTYEYTITIYPSTAPKGHFSIDPQIEVDDSGVVKP